MTHKDILDDLLNYYNFFTPDGKFFPKNEADKIACMALLSRAIYIANSWFKKEVTYDAYLVKYSKSGFKGNISEDFYSINKIGYFEFDYKVVIE